MTEKELQQAVVAMARLLGYRVYHTYDSRRSEPGFPDLVMVRGERMIFAELKSERGMFGPGQEDWLAALAMAGATTFVWRPEDWTSGDIEAVLMKGEA